MGHPQTFFIYNNAIEGLSVGNASQGGVLGLVVAYSTGSVVYNNVVGTMAGLGSAAGFVSVQNTDLDWDYNAASDTTADAGGGTNNINNVTPSDEFVDTTLATLDLHLKTGGDCEDAGENLIDEGKTNAPTTDSDGDTRPSTGSWNMGIDEHVGAPTANPMYYYQYTMLGV